MTTYSKDIFTAVRLLEAIREVDAEMPTQTAHSFLCVALQPGLTMQELADRTGLSQSSASRNVQALGEWHWNRKPGYRLVEAVPDPNDTRRKIMYLTPRGRDIAAKVVGAVKNQPVDDFESPTAKQALKPVYAARMTGAARRA